MSQANYVYIIQCMEFMKVGMARSVEKRVEGISAVNPYPVKIIETFYFENRTAAAVAEKIAHKHLKEKGFHEKLEWFQLTEISLAEAIFSIREEMSKDHGGNYKKLQDIKQIAKDDPRIGVKNLCDYMDSIGFKVESKIFRRSHNGPYCTMIIDKRAIRAAQSFIYKCIDEARLIQTTAMDESNV